MPRFEYTLSVDAPSKQRADNKVKRIREIGGVAVTPAKGSDRLAKVFITDQPMNRRELSSESIGKCIGWALKERIQELDISQAEAARRSGASITMISRLVNGKRQSISIAKLIELSVGLETTIDYLLNGLFYSQQSSES